MARFDFPELNLRPAGSPDVERANYSADVPPAFAQLARATDQLGAELGDMADRAAAKEGAAAAAADVAAGRVQLTNKFTVRGQAYDQVGARYLATTSKTAIQQAMTEAYVANPDNPVALSQALEGTKGLLKPSGRPDLDAEVAGYWAGARGDFMAKATEGAARATEAQGKANFVHDLQISQEALDRAASTAAFDPTGTARVGQAGRQLVVDVARYGPKEAFTLAGVDFPADPSRMAAMSPAEMALAVEKGLGQGTKTWILAHAEQLPTETARRLFAGELQDRWQKGDPAFAHIDGADMEQLQRHLEAGADRLRTESRADRIEAGQRAHQAIEAFRWGGAPDLDQALADAKASGDAGLEAEVQFYRQADPETRGVLHTVYARQLGLIGGDTSGAVVVDGAGNPVAGQDVRPQVAADPAKFFSSVLGAQVQVTSAKRTPAQNAAAHGVDNSDHLDGKAWDIVVPGMTSAQVFAKLRSAGFQFDQLLDEHNHVHVGLGDRMRGQALVKNGGAWTTPPSVQPGTPAYVAWAATREGFSSDPLNYVRGGANRPALAQVPILVPEGAFAQADAPEGQAWGQAIAGRYKVGQALAHAYGVPPRILTNAEREFYKAQIEADPNQGIALAMGTLSAAGPTAAAALLRELGDTPTEASAHLHIADLAASGSGLFAKAAAQGLARRAEGAKLEPTEANGLADAFNTYRGAVPASVLQAATNVALAAKLNDHLQGVSHPASWYVRGALGGNSLNGRLYGGPTAVNGKTTVAPWWLQADRADEALEALGTAWAASGRGPTWSNGQALSAHEVAGLQLQLTGNGRYHLVNRKTGNPVMGPGGRAFEVDLDDWKGELARRLGPGVVRPDKLGG